MYSTLAKTHAIPIVFLSKPNYCKQYHSLKNPQFLPIGFNPKPSLNPKCISFSQLPLEFNSKSRRFLNVVGQAKASNWEMSCYVGRTASVSSGFRLTSCSSCCRSFSSSNSQRIVSEWSGAVRDGNSLPWLTSRKVKDFKGNKRVGAYNGSSSSWKKPGQASAGSSWGESAKRVLENYDDSAKITAQSSWDDSVKPASESNRNRTRIVGTVKDGDNDHGYNERNGIVEKEGEGEDQSDGAEDPRWDKIKNKFKGVTNAKGSFEKPEFKRWNKQENWGRKTWREATESTLPKMVGEGVYGVGPVLAALSAARREFYALYVQEGLDLTSNNKKKKEKKGFEKVLKMAQKIGLIIREVSKHDLNMIVDNRPHQGLVLDASPLEMVKIMELDPVSPEHDRGSLWVALDEVTDPQNLGAIIRSSYFFGVSGIVLCAKNSAPLSGVVSKASAGSLEIMELRYCKNMMQFLVSSADNGWRVLGGSVASKAVPLNEIVPGEPTILVLGSEGTGLRPLVERSCNQLVRIPGNIPMDMTIGGDDDIVEAEETNLQHSSEEFRSFLAVESLNVSVAAGVLLHHLIGSNHDNKDKQP